MEHSPYYEEENSPQKKKKSLDVDAIIGLISFAGCIGLGLAVKLGWI